MGNIFKPTYVRIRDGGFFFTGEEVEEVARQNIQEI